MAEIGIILGSGLSDFTKELSRKNLIFEDKSGIHNKKIYLGKLDSKEIMVFEGRNHFYEKAGYNRIFFNVNKGYEFGLKLLIITNAAGGINPDYNVSDLMLITSHINLLKYRFVKNHTVINNYNNLYSFLENKAVENNIKLHKGIYCSSPGPVYETKSEIRFLKSIGVDAVGMSTVPEIIKSSSYGINTIAVSCITNLLSPDKIFKTEHKDVLIAGKKAYNKFSSLLRLIISEYPFKL